MKTSNKILLIFFVAALLMMTAVHLTLYAKYKNGEVSSFEEIRGGRFEDHLLPAVKYVSVTGFRICNIIPATETKIRIFNKSTQLSYKIVNDTLIVTGDSTVRDFEHHFLGPQTVNLYLPGEEKVNAFYTGLTLNGAADSTSAVSCSVNISNRSNLTVGVWGGKAGFFNHLQVNVVSSHADFTDKAVINELNLQAAKSGIDNRASIKNLQLQMDDQSTIVLRGNILKAIDVLKK
jgi:hypothetical protein